MDTHIKHGQSFNKVCNPYEPESAGRLLHFKVAFFFLKERAVTCEYRNFSILEAVKRKVS